MNAGPFSAISAALLSCHDGRTPIAELSAVVKSFVYGDAEPVKCDAVCTVPKRGRQSNITGVVRSFDSQLRMGGDSQLCFAAAANELTDPAHSLSFAGSKVLQPARDDGGLGLHPDYMNHSVLLCGYARSKNVEGGCRGQLAAVSASLKQIIATAGGVCRLECSSCFVLALCGCSSQAASCRPACVCRLRMVATYEARLVWLQVDGGALHRY